MPLLHQTATTACFLHDFKILYTLATGYVGASNIPVALNVVRHVNINECSYYPLLYTIAYVKAASGDFEGAIAAYDRCICGESFFDVDKVYVSWLIPLNYFECRSILPCP